jgi:hypothetical protein
MFGKKARRIRELEADLVEAKTKLVRAHVLLPPSLLGPGVVDIPELRVGEWYTYSVRFRVPAKGVAAQTGNLSITSSPLPAYFDGNTVARGDGDHSWTGDS